MSPDYSRFCPPWIDPYLLAALAPLHPVSRCIIGFYSLTNEFEIVEWMTRTMAFRGKAVLIPDLLSRATNVLRYTVSDLSPAGVLRCAPDILTFKIAKAAFLLVKVSSVHRGCRPTLMLILDSLPCSACPR